MNSDNQEEIWTNNHFNKRANFLNRQYFTLTVQIYHMIFIMEMIT